ncbi:MULTISPECIES: DUF3326 domain-containing protein [unclassified Coleofasciculus]|uniref:DUF3326 domain-containing protein n=1 Tax=Cyanophyceae TaxID=3028117 RepID=UPI0016882AB2|nr:DUF3326 domain-containing protein [Coleofasciculus sp. FACHB-T130]MBD1898171.1 DUF3326 domain-containing protein [Coleofasciculus sp. FACHB-129]MBD2086983.1 DUF3326 domain-containing protein [Coleofasciculus sp. FACHB-542]
MNRRPYTVVLIVPTGVGAAVGGYAGDALPVARAIAQISDILITHPNVLNGAQLYWNLPNAFYVEGYGLDKFAAGCWGLRPVHQNRVGLILDQGIEPELRLRHLQAADATRATLGLNLTDYVVTDAPLGVELRTAASGASWGTIGNPDSLLRAAEVLITKARAEAIAVVARFPDDIETEALESYRHGQGVDPLAGAEAVISHLIVRTFQIPCAHAPALLPLPLDPHLSPRSAAEELGYTFLPCVLVGLSRAPQFIRKPHSGTTLPGDVWADRVDAVVVPATACGGSAILSLSQTRSQIIAVEENKTQMQVPPEQVGIKALRVNSYLEALGVLVAHRAGISPGAISPTLSSLVRIQ